MGYFMRLPPAVEEEQKAAAPPVLAAPNTGGATGSWGAGPPQTGGATGSWNAPAPTLNLNPPNAFGGFDPYEPPQTATAAPSVQTPRTQPDNTAQFSPGPLASAANRSMPIPTGLMPTPATQQPSVFDSPLATPPVDYKAQLAGMQAKEQADMEGSRAAMMKQAIGAGLANDLTRAQGEQRVSTFLAKNGADAVLSGGTVRQKELAAAARAQGVAGDNAAVAGIERSIAANNIPGAQRNYFDEAAKAGALGANTAAQQLAAQKGQLDLAAGKQGLEAGKVDILSKQQKVAAEKQLAGLRTQLAASADPEEQKVLQNKIITLEGKISPADKVAVVDHDTGLKDIGGTPIFKKVAVNTSTGEILGAGQQTRSNGPTQAPKGAEPPENHIAALKANATPEQMRLYDQWYGTPGAAAKILAGK